MFTQGARLVWRRICAFLLRATFIDRRALSPAQRPQIVFLDVPRLDDARDAFGDSYPDAVFVRLGSRLKLSEVAAIKHADVIVSTGGMAYKDLNSTAARIEMWHASGAVKKIANYSYKDATCEHVICSPSEGLRASYADAFGTSIDHVVATGVPKTDAFFDKDAMAALREQFFCRYPELVSQQLFVYLPTFRGSWPHQTYFEPQLDPVELGNQLELNESFLVKLHPIVSESQWLKEGTSTNPSIKDMHGEKVSTLLAVADVVILDYSSILFDSVLLGKSTVMFAEDLEEYVQDRGLAFDLHTDLPFPLVESTTPELLLSTIRAESVRGEVRPELLKFVEQFVGSCDGHAHVRVKSLIDYYSGTGTGSSKRETSL